MNEIFEKIYAASNTNTEESKQTELFEQIYKEAEMLNEMNPKLRAMLLGGALAAGLGFQSCSMPTDPSYDPPVIEQPSNPEETPPGENPPDTPPETPENPDDTNPGTSDENNEDDENNETEENEEVTLESMFNEDGEEHKDRLLNAVEDNSNIYYITLIDFGLIRSYSGVYTYASGKFSRVLRPTSFNGYMISSETDDADYAYCIPGDDDTIALFNDLLHINLQEAAN